MTSTLNLALAQTTVTTSPEKNLATASRLIGQAAQQGTDLIVFPEMFMALPRKEVMLAAIAERVDGPFVSRLSALACEHRTAIICGIWEKVAGEAERAANVVVALGPDGQLLARYNKIHLFDALSMRESDRMTGGDTPPPLFTLKGLTLGVAICYDLRFPELFRDLALRGAEAVIVPSAWYAGPLKEDHWLTLLRARAIENTMYVCGANLCGEVFAARSAIYDPFGVPLAGSGEKETLVCSRLEQNRVQEVRAKLPTLSHVRRELFGG